MATKTATKPKAKKKVAKKKAVVPEAQFSAKTEVGSKPPAQKAVAKKAPAKRAATKKTTSTPKAKAVSKRATGKTKSGGQSLPRVLNDHGFVVGSDSEKIVDVLLEGGMDRGDINAKVLKALGRKQTRTGNDPNVSSLVANILRRLKDKGYQIESTWVLASPTPASKAAATRRANKSDQTPAATKPKPRKASAAAKRVPAKRVAKKTTTKG